MRTFLKRLTIAIGILAAIVCVLAILFFNKYPDISPPADIKVEATPERVARGEYLANHVTVCIDCHSTRNWSKFSGPITPGTHGKGGDEFNELVGGVPGRIFASNITPVGIKDYTDGELLRAFTTGVTRTNRSLFPLMPYFAYNHLTQEDAYSIVAYIRSLEPIENKVSESTLNFPMNLIVRTIPLHSFEPTLPTESSDQISYGKYVASISACGDCHTPAEKGEPISGMDYAGGFTFMFPGGIVRTANITPDPQTGIGNWTKEDFVARFKAFTSPESIPDVQPEDFNTPMPWTMYAGMTEKDLGAIYDYLRTVPPVHNAVERFSPYETEPKEGN